jgi:hypothetical protein
MNSTTDNGQPHPTTDNQQQSGLIINATKNENHQRSTNNNIGLMINTTNKQIGFIIKTTYNIKPQPTMGNQQHWIYHQYNQQRRWIDRQYNQ